MRLPTKFLLVYIWHISDFNSTFEAGNYQIAYQKDLTELPGRLHNPAASETALTRIHPGEYDPQVGLLKVIWGVSGPGSEWLHLHNHIGWIFMAFVAVHLVMHWRWIASMLPIRLSSYPEEEVTKDRSESTV